MAEKPNWLTDFIQQKLLELVGEFKTTTMAETLLSSTPLLRPKPSISSSKLGKNEQKLPEILKGNCI